MASIVASLPTPLLVRGRRALLRPSSKYPVFATKVIWSRVSVVAKAMGEGSELSTSSRIIKSVQSVWDKSEDRIAIIGLGFAAVAALWASANLITAIDKIPFIPSVLELVGVLFSSWFIYRYLLLKPDREELVQIIYKYISDILGQ